MKKIIFLALLMLPLQSFSAESEALISLLKTSPEKIQQASENLKELDTLKKLGVINATPDLIADYNHIYIAKKQVPVLSGTFLALDHEFLDNYIGCCVNPGVAVVLHMEKEGADLSAVDQFAKENVCTVTPFELSPMTKEVEEAIFHNFKKENIVVLSCKLRDRIKDSTESTK